MEIFSETDFVTSEVYNDFYEDSYNRVLINIPEDRDVYADGLIDEEMYCDGSVDAAMQTKNMR